MNQPIPAKAVHKKLGRVICDLASLPPEGLWKNHVCCALYSRKDLLEKHPKVIKAFLKMLLFASYKMASMPKKAAEATNTWTKNGIEVESISVPSIVYTSVPSQSWVDGVKTWAKVMNEMGAFTKIFKGKKSDVPDGIVQLRSASPRITPGAISSEANVPPKYQTRPDCPALQSAVSNSGCSSTGSENNHCH